ncbi:MAG TPA: flavodoxin family protein [Methanoregulaceae archaeon]|nr:flavodoxin family protein [Methanoregulaceae archaeon]HQJ87277.1 flavodoxin family protein [Methanoregulaceae archaeon]
MKIIGISASPRGAESRTARLVESVLRGAASAGAETEFIDICRYRFEFCTGCGTCYATGECPRVDDFAGLFEKMVGADGIVLGSPNYINGPTAQLKQVLDRMADAIHCRAFDGKYGCSVCTTGGSGDDLVVGYLNGVLNDLGAQTVGGVGVALGADPGRLNGAMVQGEALGRDLVEAIATKRQYPDQVPSLEAARDYFRMLVTANRETWSHEYEVWAARGWL